MPVFFYMQINKYLNDRKEYAIETMYFNDSDTIMHHRQLSKIPAQRKYFLFTLEQNKKKDSLKVLMIQNLLKGIEQSRDTSYGVKIIFNEHTKYGTIIQSMDACLKAKINTFFLRPDTLITYHRTFTFFDDTAEFTPTLDVKKQLGLFPILCSLDDFDRLPESKDKQTLFDKLKEYKPIILISLPYFIWLLIIAWLMFRKLKHANTYN